jgi:hypothetical protein
MNLASCEFESRSAFLVYQLYQVSACSFAPRKRVNVRPNATGVSRQRVLQAACAAGSVCCRQRVLQAACAAGSSAACVRSSVRLGQRAAGNSHITKTERDATQGAFTLTCHRSIREFASIVTQPIAQIPVPRRSTCDCSIREFAYKEGAACKG